MTLPRRKFMHLAAGAVALPAVSTFAWAQTYPSRPVRIIVGFAPGSSADIIARLMSQSLSERLGQQFIIDNRPGAGSNVATETAVQAEPDGHTLVMVGPWNAINATLYEKLGFDFIRDIVPVGAIARSPNVMLVNQSVLATTVSDFVALAKANPGQMSMASAGVGTASHLAGELFQMMTGAEMVHAPYRGGEGAYSDLLGCGVDAYFPSLASSVEHIKAGRVRPLAVTSVSRLDQLPSVPTMGESVPGYEASTWFGVGAPRNTPAGIVAMLNKEINASFADPKVRARLADLGGTALAGSPADFGKLIAEETEKWANVVKFSGTTAS